MKSTRSLWVALSLMLAVLAVPLIAQVRDNLLGRKSFYTRHDRAYYMEPNLVQYIRPGIIVKVTSAAIANDGTISSRVTITDPKGAPLDKDGIVTPGPVTLRFIAAYIPAGQKEYLAYTTTLAKATLNSNPAQTQAGTDSGGTFVTNALGDYTYTFKTKAPAGFDTTATHSIGVSAQRDLSEFMTLDEWADTSNDVFNFVPNGAPVTVIRSVVSTQACNQCHDPLIGHGGSRLTVEMCILCHTPQTINPDTGLTQDMPVLIHKIHMGKNLPSVKAGTPYRIWHRGQWSDFSDVGFPSGTDELQTCTVCHQNAPQANNYLTAPSRAACGSCHDDVDFASGKNHGAAALPEISDTQCAGCHIPQGDLEFDASIKGAHTVPTRSAQLPGLVFSIVGVANTNPGQQPAVTFTVNDKSGNPVDITKMSSLNLVMTGPTEDYSGYTSEDARKAQIVGGQYVYNFNAALPSTAAGSYAVGIEGYNNVTVNAGKVNAMSVRDVGFNQVFYFAIGNATVTPRRKVVSEATCTGCHNTLMLHGGIRQNVEYCVVCHNPAVTDSSVRPAANKPDESINFKTMIHKIHTGSNLATDFTIYGHGGSVNNYNEVGYPGDRRDCEQCHLPGTYDLPLPAGATSQVAPRDYLNPLQPTSGACLSCHTTKSAAAHASIMTSPTLGESCDSCHGPTSSSSVDQVHAR
jgi:OmcA/MtrC family decaheme c-type cytochrome